MGSTTGEPAMNSPSAHDAVPDVAEIRARRLRLAGR